MVSKDLQINIWAGFERMGGEKGRPGKGRSIKRVMRSEQAEAERARRIEREGRRRNVKSHGGPLPFQRRGRGCRDGPHPVHELAITWLPKG